VEEKLVAQCRDLIAPLVQADGGHMYLVSASADLVHVHLTGTCAGCPGVQMTRERLIEPVVAKVAPKATLKVTTGFSPPDGAKKIVAPAP
jgi:Fe-S cluster biogenesis protein NfuA